VSVVEKVRVLDDEIVNLKVSISPKVNAIASRVVLAEVASRDLNLSRNSQDRKKVVFKVGVLNQSLLSFQQFDCKGETIVGEVAPLNQHVHGAVYH